MTQYCFTIWGAGHLGKKLLDILGESRFSYFIDSDKTKQGTIVEGLEVKSFNLYKKDDEKYPIIVTPVFSNVIIRKLQSEKCLYFDLRDCPPEFLGAGWNTYKNIDLRKKDKINEDGIIIYGCTFYSILVYEWYKKNRKFKDVSIVPHDKITLEQLEKLKKYYSDINFASRKEKYEHKVLVTVYDRFVKDINAPEIIDIFDWTKDLIDYKNSEIEKFKGIHNGKRCFIVATGPSLRIQDLERLQREKEICISMNSIVELLDRTQWRPDYYVVSDSIGLQDYYDMIKSYKDIIKFIGDASNNFAYDCIDGNTYIAHNIWGNYLFEAETISNDISEMICIYGTVTHCCIQIAIYLGFKDIYLLGVDFSYKVNAKCYFEGCTQDEKYPMNEEFIEESNNSVLRGYQIIKRHQDMSDWKVYNATRGGKLEVFERVNFDELFH